MNVLKNLVLILFLVLNSSMKAQEIIPGAYKIDSYIKLIGNKRKVAIVCNQTSRINETHLVDSLLSLGIDIKRIFSPEHGFRGDKDAGESIQSGRDDKTNIEVVSLYGEHKKPNRQDLVGIDYVVFDIQDVGVRFYTYISTLEYVLESCAEFNVPIVVLDRPNPNGYYVDGPVLDVKYKSFIGLQPIPIVYGMTIGEYARMLVNEQMLDNQVRPNLTVIKCDNYTHDSRYSLPIAPSPNLKSDISIALYPSLCLFEGTNVSVGRGTERPFEIYGSPFVKKDNFTIAFTPEPSEGAKDPFLKGLECYGDDLHDYTPNGKLDLSFVIKAYNNWDHSTNKNFFLTNNFFFKLIGNSKIREYIEKGMSEENIRDTWKYDIEMFMKKRNRNLLYPDFTAK